MTGHDLFAADEIGRINIISSAQSGERAVAPGTYYNLLVDGNGRWTIQIRPE